MESVVYAPKKKLMEIKVISLNIIQLYEFILDFWCQIKQGVSEQKADKIQLEAMKLVSYMHLLNGSFEWI